MTLNAKHNLMHHCRRMFVGSFKVYRFLFVGFYLNRKIPKVVPGPIFVQKAFVGFILGEGFVSEEISRL